MHRLAASAVDITDLHRTSSGLSREYRECEVRWREDGEARAQRMILRRDLKPAPQARRHFVGQASA